MKRAPELEVVTIKMSAAVVACLDERGRYNPGGMEIKIPGQIEPLAELRG